VTTLFTSLDTSFPPLATVKSSFPPETSNSDVTGAVSRTTVLTERHGGNGGFNRRSGSSFTDFRTGSPDTVSDSLYVPYPVFVT
jgi:hypothetical protein